ncbi:MAG: hypothetical protein JSU00_19975 [Acidobacteria bacterium]|nr:hypothetical protein [Acidobacteriota bacterium]
MNDAEREELAGDALFFANQPGAGAHYHKARAALFPPGELLDSAEENERRMTAHRRLTEKLYALDNYDLPRPGHPVEAHPDFVPVPERFDVPVRHSALAARFVGQGHFADRDLGAEWREVGEALAAAHPRAARRAFEWSLHFLELYNRAWTAHLPASRWDSDGGFEMDEITQLAESLGRGADADLPGWVEELLEGDWESAGRTAGNEPVPTGLEGLRRILDRALGDA